jgi:putative transposase
MKIAVSEPLLVLINNYVRVLRFVLFWLKENVPNSEGSVRKGSQGVVHKTLSKLIKMGN